MTNKQFSFLFVTHTLTRMHKRALAHRHHTSIQPHGSNDCSLLCIISVWLNVCDLGSGYDEIWYSFFWQRRRRRRQQAQNNTRVYKVDARIHTICFFFQFRIVNRLSLFLHIPFFLLQLFPLIHYGVLETNDVCTKEEAKQLYGIGISNVIYDLNFIPF